MKQSKLWWFLSTPQLLLDEQLSLQSQEQQQQPQVLCSSEGQRGPYVVQANAAAHAAGIRLGMPAVSASTLVPELRQRDYDAKREAAVLKRLAQWLYQDIAHIALYPPQGLLLEVQHLQLLYGGYQGVQQQLQRRLRRLAVNVVLAAGYSPLVARILAQSGCSLLSAEREQLQAALARVSIVSSLLPAQQQQQLQDAGIVQLGDLLRLPVSELGARFGRSMVSYVAQLRGELCPPQQYFEPPAKFRERLDLLAEVASWQQLLFPLRRLLQQLEAFLQSRQLSITAFVLLAHHREGPPTRVRIAFALPLWRSRDMQQLVQLQLERQRLTTPALELSLHADEFSERQASTSNWFPNKQDAHYRQQEEQQLQRLFGKLQARLGEDAVQQAQALTDWRPEAAQSWQAGAETALSVKPEVSLPRPVWLLSEVEPITIQHWQLHWGPERIQSGWWDGHPVDRDYFIAIDSDQRQGWIFKSQGAWYLHGWFS